MNKYVDFEEPKDIHQAIKENETRDNHFNNMRRRITAARKPFISNPSTYPDIDERILPTNPDNISPFRQALDFSVL